jgi:molybdopterin converting factor small subunit
LKVTVKLPRFLQHEAQIGEADEVNGTTVQECLQDLVRRYPKLEGALFDSDGKILLKWMVYKNNRVITSSSLSDFPVSEGDEIGLVPVIAGG